MTLKGMVPPDSQTSVSQVRYVVIFTPRPSRKRYPAGCVEIFETELAADPENRRHTARMVGQPKSSEGQYSYCLIETAGLRISSRSQNGCWNVDHFVVW
jgi:hypothetical protein